MWLKKTLRKEYGGVDLGNDMIAACPRYVGILEQLSTHATHEEC